MDSLDTPAYIEWVYLFLHVAPISIYLIPNCVLPLQAPKKFIKKNKHISSKHRRIFSGNLIFHFLEFNCSTDKK